MAAAPIKKRAVKKPARAPAANRRTYPANARGYISGVGGYKKRTGEKPYYKKYRAPHSTGGDLGSMLGSWLGHGAQHVVQALSGFGDYAVEENSIMPGIGVLSPPEVINTPGGFIVRHREYIQDINATTAFTLQSFPVQPGLFASFPWLAGLADSFEEYRFRGLVYEFKSLSSDSVLSASTSSALGSVIMATSYNVNNAVFPSKIAMENYEFANSSKPSCSFMHPVECKKSISFGTGELYLRTGAVPSGQDGRLYDLGLFQIATVGMQAASGVAGELWATYEIEFFHAKFDVSGNGGNLDHLQITTATAAAPLGTQGNFNFRSLGGTVNNPTGTIYTFPVTVAIGDKFHISYILVGSVSAAITAPVITLSGCTLKTLLGGNDSSGAVNSPANGVTSVALIMEFFVQITSVATQPTITWGGAGTIPTGTIAADMFVIQIDPAVA
ncbi:capsid protein [Crucivirus-141]|nr:capsid protein [Crucivirus-141]